MRQKGEEKVSVRTMRRVRKDCRHKTGVARQTIRQIGKLVREAEIGIGFHQNNCFLR